MSITFVSHAIKLRQLFHPRFLYSIPIYQRPFSWEEEHSTQLFDDIVDAMGDEEGNDRLDSLFLGAIVLTGNMAEISRAPLAGKLVEALNTVINGTPPLPDHIRGVFDVVDGKQRLVTFKILLCLLRDLSTNGAHSAFSDLIGTGEEDNSYRLQLCSGEREFLQNHVLPLGASITPIPDQKNISDGERKLIEVRNSLHRNLLDLSAEDRARMLDYMVNHCELVIILSETIDHAFQIFLSINNKGSGLERSDILKTDLMSRLTEEQVLQYRPVWEQWNDSLGEARARYGNQKMTFFNHFRAVLIQTNNNFMDDFSKFIDPDDAQPFIDNYLIPNAHAYILITTANWPAGPYKEQMDRVLGALNWLPMLDWIPSAMLAINVYKQDPERLLQFMQKLERLAYGLLILPGGAGDRKKKYNPLRAALRNQLNGEPGKDPFKVVEFSLIEQKKIRALIENGMHKNRPAAAKLMLLRLDMEVTGWSVNDYNERSKEEGFSVEHLLPHSPAADSQWIRDFPDADMRTHHTDLIGNLFLVRESSENPKMKNFDLPDKKAILFARGPHPIHLTNLLAEQESWTPDDIVQRHQVLMSLVDKIWPIQ